MAFNKGTTERASLDELFVPSSQITIDPILRIAIYGKAKSGKSHFALSAVECTEGPLFAIDTEGDLYMNAKAFPQHADRIRIFDAIQYADQLKRKMDLVKSLDKLTDAIDALTAYIMEGEGVVKGTLVIDSTSDVWEWLGMWLETVETVKVRSTGKMQQTEWGKANRKYMELIRMVIAARWNIILTFRTQDIYDGATNTGMYGARWQKNTDHWVNFIARIEKMGDRHVVTPEGDRFGETMLNQQINDPSWKDIADLAGKHYGIKFY